jgi:transposase InsO family protein
MNTQVNSDQLFQAFVQSSYVAMLMDPYPKRIVGWELDQHMTEAFVLAALRESITQRQPSPVLIYYSDRGSQLRWGRIPSDAGAGLHGAQQAPSR